MTVSTAAADDGTAPTPVLHTVSYTVFSETPFIGAEIYYRDTDPPQFSDYSHDPYVYSPKAEADLGPSQMWTKEVRLADPNLWAMVTVSSFEAAQNANFHCVLAVDGRVVATNQGPKGAVCSIRKW